MQEVQRTEIIFRRFRSSDHLHGTVLFKQQLRASQLAVIVIPHRETELPGGVIGNTFPSSTTQTSNRKGPSVDNIS